MVEHKCENCYHYEYSKTSDLCFYCKNQNFWNYQPKEELVRQDYKTQLIHDFREYIDFVMKYYNSICGEPNEYDYGLRKGFEMSMKYIIKHDYKEK